MSKTRIGISLSLAVVFLLLIAQPFSGENNRENTVITTTGIASSSLVNWSETAKLIASDGASADWFGLSVDINGEYCVVGARDDDGQRGSAYVFKRDRGNWTEEQKLTASDGTYTDWFGISVTIQGDVIFVGADADDNENGVNAGAIYVYRHLNSSWIEHQKLLASDGTANDYFGRYVDINEDYAIAGTYYDNSITGSAYIYHCDQNEWLEEQKITASDGLPNDYFGVSASISSQYAIVGAYRDDNTNGIDAGSVYCFKRTATGWVEEAVIIASDGMAEDRFGISTSLAGDLLVVGAYYDDAFKGSAYLFNHTTGGWIEEKKLVASDAAANDFFGRSVALNDDDILIGAWGDSGASGSVYVFENTNSTWIEIDKLRASDAAGDDRLGYQIAIDGRYAVFGANQDDNLNGVDAGAAYIFEQPCPIQITITTGIGITATLKNTGTQDLTNISYSIQCDGGLIILGKNKTNTINLPAQANITVRSFVLGFGTTTIKATADDAQAAIQARVFLFLVKSQPSISSR